MIHCAEKQEPAQVELSMVLREIPELLFCVNSFRDRPFFRHRQREYRHPEQECPNLGQKYQHPERERPNLGRESPHLEGERPNLERRFFL